MRCIRAFPVGGYTKMVANLLEGIEVRLNTDYLEHKDELDALAQKVVYTGAIDAYFGYQLGHLEYRSVRFETELLDQPNFQGNAAVNYTDRETPWTRIIEHKWFEFGRDDEGENCPRPSSAANIPPRKRGMSRIIPSTTRKTGSFTRATRRGRRAKRRSSSAGGLENINTMIWTP